MPDLNMLSFLILNTVYQHRVTPDAFMKYFTQLLLASPANSGERKMSTSTGFMTLM